MQPVEIVSKGFQGNDRTGDTVVISTSYHNVKAHRAVDAKGENIKTLI